MKEYTFYYTETNYGVISVDAENEDEARELAIESANNGEISWGDNESKLELDEINDIETEAIK